MKVDLDIFHFSLTFHHINYRLKQLEQIMLFKNWLEFPIF